MLKPRIYLKMFFLLTNSCLFEQIEKKVVPIKQILMQPSNYRLWPCHTEIWRAFWDINLRPSTSFFWENAKRNYITKNFFCFNIVASFQLSKPVKREVSVS